MGVSLFSNVNKKYLLVSRHHVLDDLRPYTCTFEDCVSAGVLFERYSEWSRHELDVHRREWFCNFCKTLHHTRDGFAEHLQLQHTDLVGKDEDLEPLISLCNRMSTSDEACPLCENLAGKPQEVQMHLARHLQQLAFYTLPKLSDDSAEESEGGSDIANARNHDTKLSDNTQTQLLKISIEENDENSALFTPPSSPPRSVPDLDDSAILENLLTISSLFQEVLDDKDYQKLAKSFAKSPPGDEGLDPTLLLSDPLPGDGFLHDEDYAAHSKIINSIFFIIVYRFVLVVFFVIIY